MKISLFKFLWIFSLLPALAISQSDSPWHQHGSLGASVNGHAIEHSDGTPFLWVGDTAWGMFQQLSREDVDRYLDHRQKLGFTVIQSVAFWYPHGGGIENGPHNATNAYGHRPFEGEADTPNTANPLLVKGGGPNSPNDYWDHVDYVVQAIKKRNMYLALLPTWGRAFITPQFKGAHVEFDESEAKAYGHFLGNRYQNEPNIIWVLGGDAKAQIHGYDKRQLFTSYDKRAVFRSMAEGIVYGVTGKEAAWNQKMPAWDSVFMTFHPDGDADINSSSWFHDDAWLDANGVEVWREVNKVYKTILHDYQLTDPAKPSLFLEGSYEFGSYRHECGWVTPVKTRRQFYHTFFAGGAGHTYGAGPIWPMRGSQGDYSCGLRWDQALDFPAGRQIASIGKQFLQQHHWYKWVPDGRVLGMNNSEGNGLQMAVISKSGDSSLIYFSNNTPAEITNLLDGSANSYWFNPREGTSKESDTFALKETKDVRPPKGWEDAILVLKLQ